MVGDAKGVSTPAVKEDPGGKEKTIKDVALKNSKASEKKDAKDECEGTKFRAYAARANFLAADRFDIQYAVKEACRAMSCPQEADWGKLTRIARYLKTKPRAVQLFAQEQGINEVTVFTDTDWAGCKRTRRSTTGGCVFLGNCLIKSWSQTQATIALSSAEAELYGIVKGSSEGLGMQSLLHDIGIDIPIKVKADASAALGIVQRCGLGKLRHIHTNWLWVQDKARDKSVEYDKVVGTENPPDALTKPLDSNSLDQYSAVCGINFPEVANEKGYDIQALNKESNERAREEIIKKCMHDEGVKQWSRQDLETYCLRRSCKTGPKWNKVVFRITSDLKTREVLKVENQEDLINFSNHHKQWTKPKDTETVLVYKE